MPRGSNGIYSQPGGTSAVSNTAISSSAYNTLISDIGSEITNSLDRQGRSAMLAALQMGGFKITGMATGSASSDAATVGNVNALIPSGSVMPFFQASAPIGWTQRTDINDYAVRIISGSGGYGHGSVGLSSFIANGALGHALTTAELATHSHGVNENPHSHTLGGHQIYVAGGALAGGGGGAQLWSSPATDGALTNITIQNTGNGNAHSHALSDLLYLDMILCTRN